MWKINDRFFLLVLLSLQIAILVIVSKIYHLTRESNNNSISYESSSINGNARVRVNKDSFGKLTDGRDIERYTIINRRGLTVQIITYGSIITTIQVPDRSGRFADITLGYDSIADYELSNVPYFGALIGRVGNRISRGRFTLDGVTYSLNHNDGLNHLHGGIKGWSKVVWNAVAVEDGVRMSHISFDGDENYPGEVRTNVTYRLTDDNQLILEITATSHKKATPINLITHPYFNLAGEGIGLIDNHDVTINADYYLPSTADLISTGEIVSVNDTIFDLRKLKQSLRHLLPYFNDSGYDVNYCLRGPTGKKYAARVFHPESGRLMEIYTNQPGIQFYTGNFLNVIAKGKHGHNYPKYSGFCLETQNYPDAINHPNFPDCVLREGSLYEHWISFKFSAQ